MPPSSRVPPLLQPYVRLPRDDSILLLTSTLGATANWLIVRFLCDALSTPQDGGDEGTAVVLVSWMREYDFWRQEARKSGGLDLERLRKEGRFAFVDGLSKTFLNAPEDDAQSHAQTKEGLETERKQQQVAVKPQASTIQPARAPQTIIPARGPPGRALPARRPPPPTAAVSAASTSPAAATPTTSAQSHTPGLHALTSPDLAHLKTNISTALSQLRSITPTNNNNKILLILDNPDILLATTPNISPWSLCSSLLTLHTQPGVTHLLAHLQADTPLLSLSTPPQPLEVDQHNFLVKMAHMSRRVLGVRVLDTGFARDVSGVLRVTEQQQRDTWADLVGAAATRRSEEDEEEAGPTTIMGGENNGSGKEVLFKVNGDGSVRVFERGAGGHG